MSLQREQLYKGARGWRSKAERDAHFEYDAWRDYFSYGERGRRSKDYRYWLKRYQARFIRRSARRMLEDAPRPNRAYKGLSL